MEPGRKEIMKKRDMGRIALTVLLCAVFCIGACARYERKVVPFKMPSAYPNATEAAGAVIASKAYNTPEEAEQAFGFDIIDAGVRPVQVIFDNRGPHDLEILSETTFLVDRDDNLWPILDARLAYDRIAKKTKLGEVVPEATTSGLLAGTAGAIIGAAIGIVAGEHVGEAAMRGAAVGAAAGITMGGAGALSDSEVQNAIRDDLQTRSLQRRPIHPKEIAHGFIFFPGESTQAKELRLTVKESDTGTVHSLIMKF